MKIEISICTGLMLNRHSNPYIESTTVLSDIQACIHQGTAAVYTCRLVFSMYTASVLPEHKSAYT